MESSRISMHWLPRWQRREVMVLEGAATTVVAEAVDEAAEAEAMEEAEVEAEVVDPETGDLERRFNTSHLQS